MRRGLVVALLALAIPVWASVFRYTFVSPGRFPSTPVPQYIIVDLASELPSVDVREGDVAFSKDDDKFWKRSASAWVEVGASSGAPTDAEYWVNAAHAGLSAEKVLGTAVGTIEGLCIGITNCTPTSDEVHVGDANFALDFDLGGAGHPGLRLDTGDDSISFNRSSNQFQVNIAGTGELVVRGDGVIIADGLLVGFSGTPSPSEISVGDANFALDFNGGGAGVPALSFDHSSNTDRIEFNRSTNVMGFFVNGTLETSIDTSGLTITSFNGGTGASSSTFWRGDKTWATPDVTSAFGPHKWLSSTVNSTSTAFASIAELDVTLTANEAYGFTCELAYDTAATTTAIQLSVNGPATPTLLQYTVQQATSATAMHSSSQTAYDTVTNAGTSGGSLDLPARIAGSIQVAGTGGTFSIRFRTEVSGSNVSVKQGSICWWFCNTC